MRIVFNNKVIVVKGFYEPMDESCGIMGDDYTVEQIFCKNINIGDDYDDDEWEEINKLAYIAYTENKGDKEVEAYLNKIEE